MNDAHLASYLRRTRQLVTAELAQVLAEYEADGRDGEPVALAIREILAEWAAHADAVEDEAASGSAA